MPWKEKYVKIKMFVKAGFHEANQMFSLKYFIKYFEILLHIFSRAIKKLRDENFAYYLFPPTEVS
jgi:hypothetical protein